MALFTYACAPRQERPVAVAPARMSNEIMLNERQQALANVATRRLVRSPFSQTLTVSGTLRANSLRTEVVSSPAAGRIERVHVRETGHTVSKGEPLYTLYSEMLYTLQQEYLLAKDQSETMGANEPRHRRLLTAAENKLRRYGLTQAQIAGLQRETLQSSTTILSPAEGVVTNIGVSEGQYVQEGSPLYRVEQVGTLWVEAALYAGEAALFKPGEGMQVLIEDTSIPTKIDFITPAYRNNTQAIVVRGTIGNALGTYRPGQQVQVQFTHASKQVLTIPSNAVIRDGKGAHVYIQHGGYTFRPVPVTTGAETSSQVEITAGLHENDTVVVSGAYLLYSELVLKHGIDPLAAHTH